MARPAQPIKLMKVPGPKSTTLHRVQWLLDQVWKGNRAQMAADTGCQSASYITKIAQGVNSPGRELLEGIARTGKVSLDWLLLGNGDPMRAVGDALPTTGWDVPVTDYLLEGKLQQPSQLGVSEYLPVAGSYYSTSRYWYRLAYQDRVLKHGRSGCLFGDLLLFETDVSRIVDITGFSNVPCVMWSKERKQLEIVLVNYFAETEDEAEHLEIDWLDEIKPARANEREYKLVVPHSGDPYLEGIPDKSRPRVSQIRTMPTTSMLKSKNDLVAVSVMRQRVF